MKNRKLPTTPSSLLKLPLIFIRFNENEFIDYTFESLGDVVMPVYGIPDRGGLTQIHVDDAVGILALDAIAGGDVRKYLNILWGVRKTDHILNKYRAIPTQVDIPKYTDDRVGFVEKLDEIAKSLQSYDL